MSRNDRTRLQEIYEAICSIPGPGGGTQTTTIRGLAQYADEMRAVNRAILPLLFELTHPSEDATVIVELVSDLKNCVEVQRLKREKNDDRNS